MSDEENEWAGQEVVNRGTVRSDGAANLGQHMFICPLSPSHVYGLPSLTQAMWLWLQKGVVERDAAGLGFISEASERGLQARHPEIRSFSLFSPGSPSSPLCGLQNPFA